MKKNNRSSFQTVWKVSHSRVVSFTATGSFTIDWGDGCVEKVKESFYGDELRHQYVNNGTYTVSISSAIKHFSVAGYANKKLIEIKQWGAARWETMETMFSGACNMICTATDAPDLSKVEHMKEMFYVCHKFNSPIEHWDTKRVKTMDRMLCGARMFNQPLAKMDLKAIENVYCMLGDTPAFDQDLWGLNIGVKVDTDNLFGYDKSLADYNEKYGVQEEKQAVYSVLDGAGACRML